MGRDLKEKIFDIDSKQIELDALQQQFLVECKRFAAQSIEGRVRHAVSSHPKQAIFLGKKGLKPIKEKINQMLESVSDQVETIINRDELWLHTQEDMVWEKFPLDTYMVKENHGPDILESALKKILSPVGELLLASGLDTESNWQKQKDTFVYRHLLDWSLEMKTSIKLYNERFNELSDLVKEYEILAEKDTGDEALDLWDSI